MRDLTYEISVRGAEQAEAQVARVEQRLIAAGKAGEQAGRGIERFEQASQRTTSVVATTDRATAALQQSTQIATKAVDGLTSSTTASTTAATKVTQSLYEEARALIQAEVAATQMASTTEVATVAQTGLLTQVTAGIAKFAPYALAAQIVTQALVDWYESHEKAALAAETLAAKQDTIARASQLSGTHIRTYADAVKYMNEQFERTPAFVDHAKDALEHWNVAVSKGPLNAQTFAADDLTKNIGQAAKVVQEELGRIGFDTVNRALDQLRQHTVLGDAAFNQWAKDIGLSSVTIGVLREQVQAEDQAQRGAEQATRKHSEELKRQAAEADRLAEQLAQVKARVDALNRTNAHFLPAPEYNPLKGELPGIKPYADALQHMPPVRLNTTIDAPSIEAAIAGAGALGLERIGQPLERMVYERSSSGFADAVSQLPRFMQRAFTGGGGIKDALQGFTSMIGSHLGEGLFKAGGPLNGVGNKLAGIFGDSFGLALPGIGAALGSLVGPALSKLYEGIRRAFGGPSRQELEGRDAESKFQSQFSSFDDMVNRVGDAYAAVTGNRADAEAAVKAMLDAERLGADAVAAAIANLRGVMEQADRLRQGASQFGMSHSELVNAEKSAHDVYDYMVRMQQQGEYTQEQVNNAYLAWQKAMAAAGNEAAQAWLDARDGAGKYATGMAKMTAALQQQRDSLAQSIANEAPEDVMGVIESQTRGQIAALDAQMAAQKEALKAQAEESAANATDAIAQEFDGFEVHVPVIYDFPRLPGMPQPEVPEPVPMAAGGFGEVSGPTLFLAGEAGREQFAFSGGNKRFSPALFGRSGGDAGGVQIGSLNVQVVADKDDSPQQLGDKMIAALRTYAPVYQAIGTVAKRTVS